MRSWQSTIMATVMGISAALVTSTAFGGPGPIVYEEDHLKCYKVLKDPAVRPTVALAKTRVVGLANSQFGQERCKVQTKAAFLCAPTVKFQVNDQPVPPDPIGATLDTDFLCYKMRCDNDQVRTVPVQDQFGQRNIVIKQAQMLCTPALKPGWPLIPCENAGAPACAGECLTGGICSFDAAMGCHCN